MTRLHRHLHKKRQRVLVVAKRVDNKLVDRLTYFAAIIEPILTMPQAIQIFRSGDASGVSIASWMGYEALTVIWLWYGYAHKDRMIIVYSFLSGVAQGAVIVGALLHGGKWF